MINPITLVSRLIRGKKYVDQLELDFKQMSPSHWRTSLSGILVALSGLGWIILPQYHNQEVALLAFFVSCGFIAAADAKNVEK